MVAHLRIYVWKVIRAIHKYSISSIEIKCLRQYFPWSSTVPTFNSCTKCVGSPGIIHNRTSDWHPVSWTWMIGLPQNWSEILLASYVGHWCAWIIFWHVIHGFCTNRHRKTSGQLVQELNVSSVHCHNPTIFKNLALYRGQKQPANVDEVLL